MDLCNLSSTQITVQSLAKDFAKKQVLPKAALLEKKGEFPTELFREAHKLGILNVTIPENYGGAGLGYLDSILIAEQLGWACVGVGAALSLNGMLVDAIHLGGSDAQKKKYFSKFAEGAVAAFAMTEPGAGSDVAAVKTTAGKKGNDYVLKGTKTWISNAPVADFFVVFAKTNPSGGRDSMSAFVVDKGTPGLKVTNAFKKLGQRAFPAAEVVLENAVVSSSQRLGEEGSGFLLAMKIFDRSRPMIAALGVGLTQRCLDESLQYGESRETMGTSILKHQMIAQKIAEMGMRGQAARLLTYESCDRLDKNLPATLAASYAKTFASDAAVWASGEAIQIFGGMGYSEEYPVEKLYRDAKVLQIYEGANEIQRLIMARELVKGSSSKSR